MIVFFPLLYCIDDVLIEFLVQSATEYDQGSSVIAQFPISKSQVVVSANGSQLVFRGALGDKQRNPLACDIKLRKQVRAVFFLEDLFLCIVCPSNRRSSFVQMHLNRSRLDVSSIGQVASAHCNAATTNRSSSKENGLSRFQVRNGFSTRSQIETSSVPHSMAS